MLPHLLQSRGAIVERVEGGADAMKALRKAHGRGRQFDVAIFDVEVRSDDGAGLAELRLEAALPKINCYGFSMHASWAGLPPANRQYNLQSSASWFKHWTREFKPSPPPDSAEGSAARYRLLAEETLAAEAHLPDVAAVQQAVLTAMSKGATLSFCFSPHKLSPFLSWSNCRA